MSNSDFHLVSPPRQVTALTGIFVALVSLNVHSLEIVLQPGPDEGKDIWTTSVYSFTDTPGGPGGGRDDHKLTVGGWGDSYHSLLEFNLSNMPKTANDARLWLYNFSSEGGSPVGMYLDRITESWDWKTQGTGSDRERLWWADKPSAVVFNQAPIPAPTPNSWYQIDITSLYNAWQRGDFQNYGLQLRPTGNWNEFNSFYSSDYLGNPSLRPKLVINTGPTPLSAIIETNFSVTLEDHSALANYAVVGSTPAVTDYPTKALNGDLPTFYDAHKEEFSLFERATLGPLVAAAKIPVLGAPIRDGINAWFSPDEDVREAAELISNSLKIATTAAKVLNLSEGWKELLKGNPVGADILLENGLVVSDWAVSQSPELRSLIGGGLDVAGNLYDGAEFLSQAVNGSYLAAVTEASWIIDNMWIPEFDKLANDPPDNSYTEVFLPRDSYPVAYGAFNDIKVMDLQMEYLQALLRTGSYLEAINKSYDRYITALGAGDTKSATLQLIAILYYLRYFDLSAEEAANTVLAFKTELEKKGLLPDVEYKPESLAELQAFIVDSGLGSDLIQLFEDSYDISTELSEQILSIALDFDPYSIEAGSHDIFSSISKTLVSLPSAYAWNVPEPTTIFLIGIGLAGIGYRRHRVA